MMQWITSFAAWFQIIITLSITIVGVVTYRQPHYHNTRTLLALAALTFLTLTELLLALTQAHWIIPTRPLSPAKKLLPRRRKSEAERCILGSYYHSERRKH